MFISYIHRFVFLHLFSGSKFGTIVFVSVYNTLLYINSFYFVAFFLK